MAITNEDVRTLTRRDEPAGVGRHDAADRMSS